MDVQNSRHDQKEMKQSKAWLNVVFVCIVAIPLSVLSVSTIFLNHSLVQDLSKKDFPVVI